MTQRPVDVALRVDGVHASLGGTPILRGVDFHVGCGEVVGLLGRNGAGKTTLLRILTGVLAPDQGRVSVRGRDVGGLAARELAREVALVPQETDIPFPFTAGQLVLMGRAPHQQGFGFETAEDVAAARDALERAGVAHLADRSVFELSGGERQLVLFARALAQETPCLLLDEPTAFLDLRHRLRVLERVREFAAAGGAALVVSHDLGLAARACDILVLLSDGVVCAQGTPSEVLRPALLAEAFGIEADIVETAGGPVVVPRLS